MYGSKAFLFTQYLYSSIRTPKFNNFEIHLHPKKSHIPPNKITPLYRTCMDTPTKRHTGSGEASLWAAFSQTTGPQVSRKRPTGSETSKMASVTWGGFK